MQRGRKQMILDGETRSRRSKDTKTNYMAEKKETD